MANSGVETGQERRKPSFERIRFDLRPAKAIERKMLTEALQRLSPFEPLEQYRYIGFGSTFFSDFSLFHKALGITDMISIEREIHKQKRFEFNCPYGCIRIEFGESTPVLARLNWTPRTILWLDYDGKLDLNMLADVKHACAQAPSGSVLTVSVNAHPYRTLRETLQRFKTRVGEDKFPIDVGPKNLKGWGGAEVSRRIVVNEIEETLKDRNGGLSCAHKMRFRQLFNFHYQDNARILTVGGILYEEGEVGALERCAFEHLSFVREGAEPYSIRVPCLTNREIRHLDKSLPHDDPESLDAPDWLPSVDVKSYARVYRYFPTFAEAEL